MLTDPAFKANPRRPRRRERPWKQPAYMKWVRTLPCAVSGRPKGIQFHHLIHGWYEHRKDDRRGLPLHWCVHKILHQRGHELAYLKEQRLKDPVGLAGELWRIWEDGRDRDEAIRVIVEARR